MNELTETTASSLPPGKTLRDTRFRGLIALAFLYMSGERSMATIQVDSSGQTTDP